MKTSVDWHVSVVAVALVIAQAPAARSADVVSIWGGARGTIVMKSDGTVWTWGGNLGGKLGLGVDSATLNRVLVPSEVHGPGDAGYLNSITAIMGGEVHNVALKSDGTVLAWGNNVFGQLGNGTTNEAHLPVQVGCPRYCLCLTKTAMIPSNMRKRKITSAMNRFRATRFS